MIIKFYFLSIYSIILLLKILPTELVSVRVLVLLKNDERVKSFGFWMSKPRLDAAFLPAGLFILQLKLSAHTTSF